MIHNLTMSTRDRALLYSLPSRVETVSNALVNVCMSNVCKNTLVCIIHADKIYEYRYRLWFVLRTIRSGWDFQRYLRIRITTKWDFTTTGALEDKINFYQYISKRNLAPEVKKSCN